MISQPFCQESSFLVRSNSTNLFVNNGKIMNINKWLSSVKGGFEEAKRQAKPVLLYFCSDTCYFCQQISMIVYRHEEVSNLIDQEFIAVQVTTEMTDVFWEYSVNCVPAWIVVDVDGFIYARCYEYFNAEEFWAFCLLALGRFYCDQGKIEAALHHLKKLLATHPQSPYAPEAFFLRSLCFYINTRNPQHFKDAYLEISHTHPNSIWCKRSLVLYAHPHIIVDWDATRRQHCNYWDSEDAFTKCFATYFYPLMEH